MLKQNESIHVDYPFLVDYDLHDDILLANEEYQITSRSYSFNRRVMVDHSIELMVLNPTSFEFIDTDDRSFYEKLLEIKWRMVHITRSISDLKLWQLHSHNFTSRNVMTWFSPVDAMVDYREFIWNDFILEWNEHRQKLIAKVQRQRILEFAMIINKKFFRDNTYGVEMQIKPITFQIMLYLFDFHPLNRNTAYYKNNMLPPFRSSKRKLNFNSH